MKKELVCMSIENIKAMKNLLEQMKTMENKIKEENNKDIHSLQIKAMKKIFNYLSEVAKALDGEECCVYLDKEIIFKYNNANILFNSSVKKEILTDKKNLEHFFNCEIIGMAYPYGSFSDKVIEIAKDCGIKYSRTVCDRLNFTMPENLMKLGASCHQGYDGIFDLIDDFIAYSGNEPAVLCIWGHSYEFDLDCSWDRFETICRKLSNRDDIFYGTNCEVYLQLGTE